MNYYLIHYKEEPNYQFPHEYARVFEGNNPKEAADQIEGEYIISSIKMITNDQTGYTTLKNHLHNTLELTKEDVRLMVKEAVEDIVERKLEVFLDYEKSISEVIDGAIRKKTWSWLGTADNKKLDQVLQEKVVKQVTKVLLDNIGLDVKITEKKHD